jgi:hypothetical protein
MKRSPLFLAAVGVLVCAAMALAACDDEPTQAEANEDFCDAMADYIAALRDVRDLDDDVSVEEFEETRSRAEDAYEAMIQASAGVVEVRLDELEESREDLQAAYDDVSQDASVGEALEEVDDEIANVAREASQVLNDVSCSLEPDRESQSDE